MDVDPAFVANRKPSEFVEPGEAALDDPAVASEFLAGLNAAPSDAGLDPTAQTSPSATMVIVGSVGVQLIRSAPWSAALACNGRNGVEQVFKGYAVVNVGPGQDEGERDTAVIGDQVTLGAWSAPIRRVRACSGTPFSPRWTNCPCRHGSSRSGPPPAAAVAAHDADGATRRLPANPATVASRSRPSRIPSPPGASPTEYQCAGRTECRSTPHAPEQVAGHLWASAKQVAAVARRSATALREQGEWASLLMMRPGEYKGFERRS